MSNRIFASIAFLVGGTVSVLVILAVSKFGQDMAGMSAGSVHRPSVDSLIPWIAGSYFVASAASVLLARKRESLRLAAVLSHLILLVLYLAICSEGSDNGGSKFLSDIVVLAIITLVFFSPWFAVWAWILFKRNDAA
jgi:hypothetical protein